MKKKIIGALVALGLVVGLAACTESNPKGKSVSQRETQAINTGFDRLTQSQQVPSFDYSQERQTLIDLLTVRAEGTHGTAYAVTISGELIWWCPARGAPVPSTYQLTNPDQIVGRGGRDHYEGNVVPLGEPSGVYSGDSAATWTVCLDDAGTAFAKYEENNVGWTSGIVNDLPAEKRARVDEITFQFSERED